MSIHACCLTRMNERYILPALTFPSSLPPSLPFSTFLLFLNPPHVHHLILYINNAYSFISGLHFTILACQFIEGDFLNMQLKDWTDADVTFMNSTCYDDALIKKITSFAGQCYSTSSNPPCVIPISTLRHCTTNIILIIIVF